MLRTISKDQSIYRLRVVASIIPVIAILVLIRLYYWQVIKGPSLASQASKQHQEVVVLNSRRGDILASDGNILAGTQTLYHLFVYKPQLEKSSLEVADLLSVILAPDPPPASPGAIPISKEQLILSTKAGLLDRLSLQSNWVSLKHYLTSEQKKEINNLKIDGLGFEDEYLRFYPEASLSAHLLGFVGADIAGQPQGYLGIEGFLDRQLRGREGKVYTEKDALGNPILVGRYDFFKNVSGRSVITTIDRNMQYLIEGLLKDGVARYQAQSGNVIVMESKSGQIKAMAGYPSYDPAHFSDSDSTLHRNPNVANLFEPGSIFKVIVMAAALDEGVVKYDTKCDEMCNGPLTIGKYTIKTWNDEYHPGSTMNEGIINSDNTVMVYSAFKLGKSSFAKYLDKFGFGSLTGVQLQDEVAGKKIDSDTMGDIDLATNSFGQGLVVTPIQMVTAVNAIANKGLLVRPTIIEKLTGGAKDLKLNQDPPVQVISAQTAETIKQMMINAVEKGEAKWAKPKGIKVAGKTGTAQVVISGKYDAEKTIASFVGFFPAHDPLYTIIVSLREPQTSIWGSETAAPLWFSIANQIIMQN